jgi:hypothetical protein
MGNLNTFISFVFVSLLIPATLDRMYKIHNQQANGMDQDYQCDRQYDCYVALIPVSQD